MDNTMIDPFLLLWSQTFYPIGEIWQTISREQKNAWYDFKADMFDRMPEFGYEIGIGDVGTLEDFYTSTTAQSKNWW